MFLIRNSEIGIRNCDSLSRHPDAPMRHPESRNGVRDKLREGSSYVVAWGFVLVCAISAFAAPKSASAYYGDAAFQYIENRLPTAEITCNEGLQYYPNDQKLQMLLDRIHEAKNEQQNENKKNDPKNDQNQDQNNQDQNQDQNQDKQNQDQNKDQQNQDQQNQNQNQNDQKQPPLSDNAKQVLARALQLCKDGKYAEGKQMLENLIAEDETASQLSGHVQRIDDVIEIKAGRKPKTKIDASNTDNDLEVI